MQKAIKYLELKKIDLENELANINTILNAIKRPIDFSKFKPVRKANERPTKIPEAYNSKLKYPAQVLWSLKNFGPQTVTEIVETLEMIYGTEDKQKLFNGLTYAASILHKKGALDAERVSKANKYSLKEKGDQMTAPNKNTT